MKTRWISDSFLVNPTADQANNGMKQQKIFQHKGHNSYYTAARRHFNLSKIAHH